MRNVQYTIAFILFFVDVTGIQLLSDEWGTVYLVVFKPDYNFLQSFAQFFSLDLCAGLTTCPQHFQLHVCSFNSTWVQLNFHFVQSLFSLAACPHLISLLMASSCSCSMMARVWTSVCPLGDSSSEPNSVSRSSSSSEQPTSTVGSNPVPSRAPLSQSGYCTQRTRHQSYSQELHTCDEVMHFYSKFFSRFSGKNWQILAFSQFGIIAFGWSPTQWWRKTGF